MNTTFDNSNPNVESPLQIDSDTQLTWDDGAEIVVVGYGGAGVCAALEAGERGASVITIDRFEGGGATAQSVGVIYAGGGTEYQKARGVKKLFHSRENRLIVDHSGAVIGVEVKQIPSNSKAPKCNDVAIALSV
ncbi:FAD-binding protein [Pseudomaricurvus alkylphenolicus]|uniref:FAD-dependent oxidoreductase n=1 Tax=Pseudomaricurvus alkylphenolicus TaxID=1306991 RepID=UPI001421F2EB|nr:FAD-dependent oxidoreductase [Pseudomaricurvus alkylphenolicus]NIB40311.1 FAD-binding protein [Pseudomaricurvus alkylphenolicus]